jgi:hypothetical protein
MNRDPAYHTYCEEVFVVQCHSTSDMRAIIVEARVSDLMLCQQG